MSGGAGEATPQPGGALVYDVDVAVVGGGAAGLATAIFAARANPALCIVVLDGAEKLGAKILVAGGGRCNVTHRAVAASDYCGGSQHVIRRVLDAFPVAETVEWFREMGAALTLEETGKYFPESNRARTVLDALLGEATRRGVRILTGRRVVSIRRGEDGAMSSFVVDVARGAREAHGVERSAPAARDGVAERVVARRVVLATGGQSLPKSGSDGFGFELARRLGHTIVRRTPALVPLVLEEAGLAQAGRAEDGLAKDGPAEGGLAELSGVSHEAEIVVRVAGEKAVRVRGSVLWTHFGLSGPATLDVSRHWLRARAAGRAVEAFLSFVPGSDFAAVDKRLSGLFAAQARAKVENVLRAIVSAERVALRLLSKAGISSGAAAGQVSREARRMLAHAMTGYRLPIRDSRGYNYAEATAGGVELTEIDPRTMASRVCAGLYLVGEILDVDGRIGGFNFQWAWAGGKVVGEAVAKFE